MWASGQSDPLQRRRGMVMLILCAGAGIRSNEVGMIIPEHITVSGDGVLIEVLGTTPRHVPLLAEWEEWMLTPPPR